MLERIGKVIEQILDKNKKLERLKVFSIVAAWKEIVGEKIAMKAKVYDFKSGELIIVCNDPMWRMELELRKELLIEKMNEYMGKKLVKKIKIWRGYYGE